MIDRKVQEMFPDLHILTISIHHVAVRAEDAALETFKKEFITKTAPKYTVETLKDVPELRLYRDFFWKIGIDPTKVRPASEALLRRVVQGHALPVINSLVDTYNLASMETLIPFAAFDKDTISSDLLLRLSSQGEDFTGIGMKAPVQLKGNELVIEAGKELVAVYPYRDADKSKVTLSTKNVLIVVCGVPGISIETLKNAQKIVEQYITRFCGGYVRT